MKTRIVIFTAAVMLVGSWTPANASITGNPLTDGWTSYGNSLEEGTYVRGTANYGYDAYGTSFAIASGSDLEISAGANSWLVGDTVLGGGGLFNAITDPTALGWTGLTGGAVNSLLTPTSGLKIQAKFGSSEAAWSVSTIAPSAGDGVGDNPSGGANSTQVRTSGSRNAASYSTGSGALQILASSGHIVWANASSGNPSTPSTAVARLIWNFDSSTGMLGSWEILLNASLFDRLYNGNTETAGNSPWIGDMILLTVQNGDGAYTDALVSPAPVPEPTTLIAGALLLLPFGASTIRRMRKNRAA